MKSALRRPLAIGLLAVLALLVPAAPGQATFHEMSIREIYPGSAAEPAAEYVELQMWAAGQNLVGGHVVRTYGPGGAIVQTNPFPANVASSANQSTILMATPESESKFGLAADGSLSPSGQLDPAGGAICWESLDCVSWGSFSGSLPSPAGSPAAPSGIPDGMALRRTIAPGCATLLEPADDSDNSATDFSTVFPAPRPNSVAPSEHSCSAAGGGAEAGGGKQGRGAPQTLLRGRPAHRTRDRTPTFRFAADEPGVTFQCKLDRKPYRRCRSPLTTKPLAIGGHMFQVRARDDSGKVDPSPASYRFRVVRFR